jgi:hypothetical protein
VIPLVLVVGALAVGIAAGWIMRAENGRGTPRPTTARRCAPPYDWAQEPDL